MTGCKLCSFLCNYYIYLIVSFFQLKTFESFQRELQIQHIFVIMHGNIEKAYDLEWAVLLVRLATHYEHRAVKVNIA